MHQHVLSKERNPEASAMKPCFTEKTSLKWNNNQPKIQFCVNFLGRVTGTTVVNRWSQQHVTQSHETLNFPEFYIRAKILHVKIRKHGVLVCSETLSEVFLER